VKPYKYEDFFLFYGFLLGNGVGNLFASPYSRFHYIDEGVVGFWTMSYVIEDRQRKYKFVA